MIIYSTAIKAIDRARQGKGPSFIEAITYRWNEHVGEKYDDHTGQRTKEELEYWMSRDPILFLERQLLKTKVLTDNKKNEIYSGVKQIIQESFEFAISSPLPTKADLLTNVYP